MSTKPKLKLQSQHWVAEILPPRAVAMLREAALITNTKERRCALDEVTQSIRVMYPEKMQQTYGD